MELGQIISGIIIGLIAVLLGIYVSFTARQKGPILSNSYLLASKQERERMDLKAEYKLVTVVFSSLTGIFTLLSIYIFTSFMWVNLLMWALIAFVIIYAIVDAVKTATNKTKD